MKRFIGALLDAAPAIAIDIVGIAGGAAITYGAWLIYRPAGFIIGGALAMLGAWLVARAG